MVNKYPQGHYDDILKIYYSQSFRKFHTWDHIVFGFAQMSLISDLLEPEELFILSTAWKWHDAVYKIGNPYNEEDSIDLRNSIQRNLPNDLGQRIDECIRATRHPYSGDVKLHKLISDIDLSILGQPLSVYDNYKASIREEYASVPDEVFYPARKNFLNSMLKEPIYKTHLFHHLYEVRARQNIAWDLG